VLTDREASLLLPDLTPEGFLLEIPELQFVEDAPDLEAERGLLVVAVEPVGDGHDTDPREMELREHGEHEIVVAGEPGQVVDQHDLERAMLAGRKQRGQPPGVSPGARLGLISVGVLLEDHKSALGRDAAAVRGSGPSGRALSLAMKTDVSSSPRSLADASGTVTGRRQ